MKTKCLLIFLLFNFQAISNEDVIYVPNDIFPKELKLLIESIHATTSSEQNSKILKNYISIIDKMPNYLKKEEIFFLIKTETYKVILEEAVIEDLVKITPDENILSQLKKKILESSSYTVFSNYIIHSITHDIEEILSSPYFQNLILKKIQIKKAPESQIKKNILSFKRLYYWYEKVSDETPQNFNHHVYELSFKILKRIANNAQLIFHLSKVKTAMHTDDKKINNFKLIKQPPLKKDVSPLDKLINSSEKEKQPSQKNEIQWMPRNE